MTRKKIVIAFILVLILTGALTLLFTNTNLLKGQISGTAQGDQDGDGIKDHIEADIGTDPLNPDTDAGGVNDGDEFLIYGTDPLNGNDDDPNIDPIDSDKDKLTDILEIYLGINPFDPDTDDGGISDGVEVTVEGNDPLDPSDDNLTGVDPDSDGLSTELENIYGTDPFDEDTDSDGTNDYDEIVVHLTDPLDEDTDDDNLSDGEELHLYDTNPLEEDTDSDGINDGDEVDFGLNPLLADTDGGGVDDLPELFTHGTDPLDPQDDDPNLVGVDSDNDQLIDTFENFIGTDPLDPDTDDGGTNDGNEVLIEGTDPLDPSDDDPDADSDSDGLTDQYEYNVSFTDPFDPDTDEDGLTDFDEIHLHFTDPLDEDTDNGGVHDGQEVNINFTDPLDPFDDILEEEPQDEPEEEPEPEDEIDPLVAAMTAQTCSDSFGDVHDNDWHQPYICRMALGNVIQGLSPGVMGPNQNVTKAEAVKMFLGIMGYKAADTLNYPSNRPDVHPVDWYYYWIGLSDAIELTRGEGNFEPNEPATRGWITVIAARAADLTRFGFSNEDLHQYYSDVHVFMPEAYAILALTETPPISFPEVEIVKVIEGYPDKTFRPQNNITRAEVSAVISRLFHAYFL